MTSPERKLLAFTYASGRNDERHHPSGWVSSPDFESAAADSPLEDFQEIYDRLGEES